MKQSTGLLIAAGFTAIVMACAGTAVAGIAAINAVDAASSAQRQQPQTVPQAAPQAAPQPKGPVVELEQSAAQDVPPTAQTTRLSADEAVAIAMRLARGATLLETPTLVTLRRNVQAYEIKMDVGTLYIEANTGRLLGVTRPQNPPPTPGSRGARENENKSTSFENDKEQEHDEND